MYHGIASDSPSNLSEDSILPFPREMRDVRCGGLCPRTSILFRQGLHLDSRMYSTSFSPILPNSISFLTPCARRIALDISGQMAE